MAPNPDHISQIIAGEISARPQQVASAVALLDEGSTVPFIARYRKEVTGGLDDSQLRLLEERLGYLRELILTHGRQPHERSNVGAGEQRPPQFTGGQCEHVLLASQDPLEHGQTASAWTGFTDFREIANLVTDQRHGEVLPRPI